MGLGSSLIDDHLRRPGEVPLRDKQSEREMQRFLRYTPVAGLMLGLAALAPRAAMAQDTQARDTATIAEDTTQNPPGYRGMERPSDADSVVASDSVGSDTSAVDTTVSDSLPGASTATDSTRVGDTRPTVPSGPTPRLPAERGDTTGQAGGAPAAPSGP